MKSASDFVALLRLIMYDVLGLVIPGAVFLFLIREYSTQNTAAYAFVSQLGIQTTQQIVITLLVAYLLGYLLQAISYRIAIAFRAFGQRLLGRTASPAPNPGVGISNSNLLTRDSFGATKFYDMAKLRIASSVGIVDAESLSYGDVQNLAFSLAPDEAELARLFRFRSDLCGAIATLVLLHFIGLFFLFFILALRRDLHLLWCFVPGTIIAWMFSLGKWPGSKHANRFRWFIPSFAALVLGALVFLRIPVPQILWTVPLLAPVWFFFLYRSTFYGDIGGRTIFYMAFVASSTRQGPE
jgi:hypothetical protein